MTAPDPDALARFLEVARAQGVEVRDQWGESSFVLEGALPHDGLRGLADSPGILVVALVGDSRYEVAFGPGAPSDDERAVVGGFATGPSDRSAALSVRDGFALVELVLREVAAARVVLRCRGWSRTVEGLRASVERSWASVAEGLAGLTTVAIGDREIAVRSIAPEGAPFPIAVPEDPEPGEESMRAAWDLFRQIADASSWAALALNVDRRQAGVRAAFYGDHRADIPIELERAAGGVRLLQWVHATDDANRLEAFRHVLRMASLGSPGMLPSADNVRTLAERERIALSRENAAEVQRAISGGHREASDSLVEASTHMADLVHSAAKAVNATLIAAVGVFALSGDSGALLGPEVLWPVAAALVLVAGLSSRASDRRLMDQKAEVEARRDRLSEDPLLPEADHERIAARFAGFGLDARLKGARRTLWAFFLVSAVVILVGAAIVAEQPRETASGNSGSAQQETPVPVPKKSLRPSLAPTPQPAVSSAP